LTDSAPGLIKGVLLAKIQATLGNEASEGPALSTMLLKSHRQAQAIAHLRGARILLAEDNEVNREIAV
jgi:hypothetical protein